MWPLRIDHGRVESNLNRAVAFSREATLDDRRFPRMETDSRRGLQPGRYSDPTAWFESKCSLG
jgi:hypothetical protein